MKKDNKTRVISIGASVSCLVVCMVIMAVLAFNKQDKSFACEVEELCVEIKNDVEDVSEIAPEKAMSSNPYDYIEDSKAYNDLVELGIEAIPEIGKNICNESDGLNSYILAIAIEDIADCNVYEETGINWTTGKEFVKAWNEMVSNFGISRSGETNALNETLIIQDTQTTQDNKNEEKIEEVKYDYSRFYKRIICRDCGKSKYDENQKDSYGHKRQLGIQFCKYHENNTSLEAEFIECGYTDYNCMAYALGQVYPCNWMWPSSWGDKPSIEEAKVYFEEEGYKVETYNREKISEYKEKKVIFVYAVLNKEGQHEIVHFGRTDTVNNEDVGEYEVVSKWGMGAVYKTKTVESFVEKSGYGKCVLVCYK